MTKLIIVANRLSHSIKQTTSGLECLPSPGGLAAAMGPIRKLYRADWVGWSGLERPLTPAELEILNPPRYAHMLDIHYGDYQDAYYTVSNGVLWPILHGIKPVREYTNDNWQSYKRFNQLFADKIKQLAKPNDIIWIHDFHLLLVAGMLRAAGLKNKVGFFLHAPVADAKLILSVPNIKEILTNLATADLLGLQINRDVINLKECYKMLGIKPPRIKHFPIGIDYKAYHKAVQKAVIKLKDPQHSDQKIILSVSRLDYTKGILNQLRAVDKLFSDNPNIDATYKLVVSPSREGLEEYRQLKKDIDALVVKINKQHNRKIVDYEYRNFNFAEMVSSYRQADVLLINPVSDGMNLIAKEYIAARDHPGVLVLSKTTGAAQQLSQALQVDSEDVEQIADALHVGLTMSAGEKAKRWSKLQKNVREQDVFHWAANFLESLDKG